MESQIPCAVKTCNTVRADENIICPSGRPAVTLTGDCRESSNAENKHLGLSPDANKYMKKAFYTI